MRSIILRLGIWIQLVAVAFAEVPLGRVWERVDGFDNEEAHYLFTEGGTTYAVGNGGTIWTTGDRKTWLREKTLVSDDLRGFAKTNGVEVAVGAGGRVLSRSPGGEWNVQPSGVSESLRSVAFGGGFFVAVGDVGTIIRSVDGVNWEFWANSFTSDLSDVIWNGSSFIAVGDASTVISASVDGSWVAHPLVGLPFRNLGRIQQGDGGYIIDGFFSSVDGVTWSAGSFLGIGSLDMAFGSGVYVVSGSSGNVAVSADGIDWRTIKTGLSRDVISVEWDGAQFIAIDASRNLLISNDGIRWTSEGFGNDASLLGGCWAGDQFVLVGSAQEIYTSPNGLLWTTETTPPHGNLVAAAFSGDRIVAVGEDTSILHSTDGQSWEKADIPGSWHLWDVHWSGSEFIVVGSAGVIFTSPNGMDWEMSNPGRLDAVTWDGSRFLAFSGRNVLTSSNGNDWAPLAMAHPGFKDSLGYDYSMNDLVWTGAFYVAVGENGWILKSDDGISWTKGGVGGFGNHTTEFYSVVSTGSLLLAGGRNILWSSSNGVDWSIISHGAFTLFQDIAWNGSTFMTVGGTEVKSSSDGMSWTTVHTRTNGDLRLIVWSGSEWVMGGAKDVLGFSRTAFVAVSDDGSSWVDETGNEGATVERVASIGGIHYAVDSAGEIKTYSGGAWGEEALELSGSPVAVLAGASGVHVFSEFGMGIKSSEIDGWSAGDVRVNSDTLTTVVSGGGRFVVGTRDQWSDSIIMSSLDGENWSEGVITDGSTGPFLDSVWTGSEFHVVSRTGRVASSDGINWTNPAPGECCLGDRRSLAVYEGTTIIGGVRFTGGATLWIETDVGFVERAVSDFGTISGFVVSPEKVLALGSGDLLMSEDGENWSKLNLPRHLGETLEKVIHSPLGFFAVGDQGDVLRSLDGEVWSRARANSLMEFSAVAFGNGKAVVAGNGIMTSSNGESWDNVSIGTLPDGVEDVTWGGDRFVAVGENFAAYSVDGISWEIVEIPSSPLFSISWTGVNFVAGAANGLILTSDDGASWNVRVIPRDISSLASGNGVTMVTTSEDQCFVSPDGVNWSLSLDPTLDNFSGEDAKVYFLGGSFFCLYSSRFLYSSPDGVIWTPSLGAFKSMAWTGSEYVAIDDRRRVMTSLDGVAWTTRFTLHFSHKSADLIWTGSQLVSVGTSGTAYSSVDGVAWTALATGTTTDLVQVVWTGSQLVALDENGELVYFDSGPALPEGITARGLAMIGGQLVATCDLGIIAVLNGETWSLVDTGAGVSLNVISLISGKITAMGNSGAVVESSTAQIESAWSLRARSAKWDRSLRKIVFKGGALRAVRKEGDVLSSPDGIIWSLPSGDNFGIVISLEIIGAETLYFQSDGLVTRELSDGTNHPEDSGTLKDFTSVASSSDRLVAVGEDGVILLSKSGNEVPFGFDRWIAEQGAVVGSLEFDGDWDGDGVSNGMEYLHGFSSSLEDSTNDVGRLPGIDLGEGDPRFVFEISTDYQDMHLQILRSTDFNSWQVVAEKFGLGEWGGLIMVQEVTALGGRKVVSILDSSDTSPKAFYQLVAKPR